MADVGVGVDPRNDQVDFFRKAEQRQGHTVRGRAVRHEGGSAIRQQGFVDAQWPLERFYVSRSGPVAVRRKDGHLANLPHRLRERQDPRGLNAVIVGHKNVHEFIRFGGRVVAQSATYRDHYVSKLFLLFVGLDTSFASAQLYSTNSVW